MTGPARGKDGRHARSIRTRAEILEACRVLLRTGTLRPFAREIAHMGGVSVRSVFQHFPDVDALYTEALKDPSTMDKIVDQLRFMTLQEMARAVVLGRLPNV